MTKLIVGCGYLGRRVALRWRAEGANVLAITRRGHLDDELIRAGVEVSAADVTRPETLEALPQAESVLYAVGFDRTTGRSRRQVYVDGLRNVLDRLPPPGKLLFVSSTGVYGEAKGAWVNESSACQPTREAGVAFLAAEELLRSHPLGARAIVLRMAGMYGPGRLLRADDIVAGRPLPVPAVGFLNLIHVDDMVSIVLAADRGATPPRTYVAADGHPVDRRGFYGYLAELLAAPSPTFVEPADDTAAAIRETASKRVSGARVLSELGIRLQHPSYREGLAAVLAATR